MTQGQKAALIVFFPLGVVALALGIATYRYFTPPKFEWPVFHSEECGFSCRFPAYPPRHNVKDQKTMSVSGNAIHAYKAPSRNHLFGVACKDISDDGPSVNSITQFMRIRKDTLLAEMSGDIVREEKTTFLERECIRWYMHVPEKGSAMYLFFLVEKKLVIIVIEGNTLKSFDDKETRKFLKSFRIHS